MMNIINKNTLISLALLTFTLLSSIAQAEQEKLNSTMGYPYKLLINRANTVKIIYSESDNSINCKVVVNWAEQEIQSQSQHVSRKAFSDKPLASCLPREKAKSMLAATFQ